MIDLTIRQLNSTKFIDSYKKFLKNDCLDDKLNKTILSIAIVFLNCKNINIKKLGYRIILIYSNKTNDYKPLYDIAINMGLNPISHYIDKKIYNNSYDNLFIEFNKIFEDFNKSNDLYYTAQQSKLIKFYEENNDKSICTIAPTSYGKTDLIISTFEKNLDKNICVITPTKALLSQTSNRLKKQDFAKNRKLIVYPEMYNKENHIWAIMTQERLLRLLRKDSTINFDVVIIDEAHTMLNKNFRSKLLASVIVILNKRNPNTKFKYFTPFLNFNENLNIKYINKKFEVFKVDEYIKTEMIYYFDFRKEKKMLFYDQFLNFFDERELKEHTENLTLFVNNYAGNKNIVYLNKSKDIEDFSEELSKIMLPLDNEKINWACKTIADYIHPQYKIIDSLKKGLLYHHGSMPDFVRAYIEKLYNEINEIRYNITSSTLLEGVNLPADKIFILDYKKGSSKLSNSDFKNLIGRICRFNRIFTSSSKNLHLLQPEIYVLESEYTAKNANVKNFISNNMYVEKKQKDILENVLLENAIVDEKKQMELKKSEEFIENFESGSIGNNYIIKAKTNVGKLCYLNNINEIDILNVEFELDNYYSSVKSKGKYICNAEQLFITLSEMFFIRTSDENLLRLNNLEARKFYSMFLNWKINNVSFREMIDSFMKYWQRLIDEKKDTLVFVGKKWGELTRNGKHKLWVDVSNKSQNDLINLSIVRIKEEQDFLDNIIIKYIEVLNDLKLIDNDFYLKIKYGTNDLRIITLVKNGMSLYLARLLVEKYLDFLAIDVENSVVIINSEIIDKMKKQFENDILITEAEYYI